MRPPSALLALLSAASAALMLTIAVAQGPGPPQAAPPADGPAKARPAVKARNAPAERNRAGVLVPNAGPRRAIAVQKMPVPAVPVPAAPLNVEQLFQTMLRQCRPTLRAEFHVVRAACRPTPEQLKAVARAGEAELREIARNYAERPMTNVRDMAFNPRKQLQQGFLKALPTILPAEKAALYEKDLARRAEARRHSSIRAVVAHLDRDLLLDAKQRAEIERSLKENWDEHWGQSPQQFMNNNPPIYPLVPNRVIEPFLSASQTAIWHGAQKGQRNFGLAVFSNNRQDPLEDHELREARLEAEKRESDAPANARPGPGAAGEIPKPFQKMVEQMKQRMKAVEKAQRKP